MAISLIFILLELMRPSNPIGSQWPLEPWHQCLINSNAISIFINGLVTVIDPSMTPWYLNWRGCYFMIKLMMRSKAWSQSWPRLIANAHWIQRSSIIITSNWHHWSIIQCPIYQPVPIVTIDPHGHGRSVIIIVDFVTVQGKVMADPLAQPYSERALWRYNYSLDC